MKSPCWINVLSHFVHERVTTALASRVAISPTVGQNAGDQMQRCTHLVWHRSSFRYIRPTWIVQFYFIYGCFAYIIGCEVNPEVPAIKKSGIDCRNYGKIQFKRVVTHAVIPAQADTSDRGIQWFQ